VSETPGWSTPGESATPVSVPAYGGSTVATAPPRAAATADRLHAEGPALVPLRPMATGELLDTPFAVLRRYPKVVLTVSGVVIATTFLLELAVLFVTEEYSRSGAGANDAAWYLFELVNGSVAAMVLAGAFAVVYGEAAVGRPVTLPTVWAKVRRRKFALVLVALVAGLAPWVGLVALVLPGIFLWGALALSSPALMLEDQRVWAALRRSWQLSTGDWWRIWGLRILAEVIAVMVTEALALPFTVIAQLAPVGERGFAVLDQSLRAVGVAVGETVSVSLSAGVLALLYIDRRMRVEGLDISLAAAARGERDQEMVR
jgi:hypothetical protein